MRSLILEIKQRNPLLYGLGVATFFLSLVLMLLFLICSNGVNDVCAWVKPIKFTLSFGIYLWTMAWLLQYLKIVQVHVNLLSRAIALCIFLEICIILLQSLGGYSYHINIPFSPVMSEEYKRTLLELGNMMVLANTLIVTYVATLFFQKFENLPSSYLWGIRLGFIIFIASCLEGEYILIHYGQIPPAASSMGMPFSNLNTAKGSLIAAHFIGIHSLQLLPLFGYIVRNKKGGTRYVCLVGALYLFTMGFFIIKAYMN